jgi:hypothetical protein
MKLTNLDEKWMEGSSLSVPTKKSFLYRRPQIHVWLKN